MVDKITSEELMSLKFWINFLDKIQ